MQCNKNNLLGSITEMIDAFPIPYLYKITPNSMLSEEKLYRIFFNIFKNFIQRSNCVCNVQPSSISAERLPIFKNIRKTMAKGAEARVSLRLFKSVRLFKFENRVIHRSKYELLNLLYKKALQLLYSRAN